MNTVEAIAPTQGRMSSVRINGYLIGSANLSNGGMVEGYDITPLSPQNHRRKEYWIFFTNYIPLSASKFHKKCTLVFVECKVIKYYFSFDPHKTLTTRDGKKERSDLLLFCETAEIPLTSLVAFINKHKNR